MFVKMAAAVLLFWVLADVSPAQSSAATGQSLSVQTTTLPKAFLRQPYRLELKAQGGVTPFKWELSSGSLPRGVSLSEDGFLSGIPAEAGQFSFVVTVRDNGKPAQQRNQRLVLDVAAPLMLRWSQYPKIAGQRAEGAIKVSNSTGQDFDFTLIVLAVNDIGRATALGYQHFTLSKDTIDFEIPFGENLPRGAYQVNVDAVGEVEAMNTIYRARLVTGERLQVQQGP